MSELDNGLVEESEPMGTALRELATVGIDRQLPVEGDAAALVEPVAASPNPQNPRASSHEMALNVKPS